MVKSCTKCKWESNCISMEGDFSIPPGECQEGNKWEPVLNCESCYYYYIDECNHDYFCKSMEYYEPKREVPEEDKVNHPKHYNMFCTEVIDVIKSCLTEEEFKGYLKGNMLKYRMRAGFKNKDKREEDLDKSNWYQDKVLGET